MAFFDTGNVNGGRCCFQATSVVKTTKLPIFDVVSALKSSPNEDQITAFLNSLLDGYDGRIRPNFNGEPVEVTLSLHVLSLGSVAETTMDYKATVFLRQMWTDPRLKFNEFNSSIALSPSFLHKLWVPDTYVINEKEANFHMITTENKLLRLSPKGEILYSARITLTMSCPMKLHRFPMDHQKCVMTMESYAYTTSDVNFKWKNPKPLDLDDQINLPQFDITNYSVVVCTREYATGAYPCLEAQFFLSRQMGYYLIQTYIPSFLIVILSWLSFWISADASPARVALGITTVLTMTTQSSGILQSLPKVSYVKAIDLWMAVCLMFVFAALIEFAFVNYYARQMKKKDKAKAEQAQKETEQKNGSKKASFVGEISYASLSQLATDDNYVSAPNDLALTQPNGEDSTNNNILTNSPHSVVPLVRADSNNSPVGTNPPVKDDGDITNLIDSMCQKIFPASFMFFNLVYWFWFSFK